MTYRFLSVCSGIEAFSVAVQDLDFEAAAFSEIEDFPSKVLSYHYPDIPNLGDMTKINTAKLGTIDWLVGGVPCQSFSVAGLRRGLDDDRGQLTLEFVRLAHELASGNGLRGLLFENVPGILSQADNPFGCLLGGLIGHDDPLLPGDKPNHGKSGKFWRWIRPGYHPILDQEGEETGEFEEVTEGYHLPKWPNLGMASGPRARLAWRVLDSRFFGVAQRRRRVFLVADFGDGPDPAAVLFESRGKGRSVAASREARQEVAGTLGGSSQSGGVRTTDLDGSGAFVVAPVTGQNSRTGNERTELDMLVAHSLSAEGADASEDGTGRGTPLVTVDIAPTIRAGGNRTGGDRPPGSDVDTMETLVIYSGNAEGGNADLPSINASNGKKGINNQTPLISVFDPNQITNKDNRSVPEPDMAHALPAQGNAPVLFSIQERATSTNLENGPGGKGYQEDIAYTMEARNKVQAIAFNPQAGGKQTSLGESDLPGTLGASQTLAIAFNHQMGSKAGGVGAAEDEAPTLGSNSNAAVAFALRGREGGNMPELGGDQANALRGADGGSSAPMALTGPQVRRLTPLECERLQAFPLVRNIATINVCLSDHQNSSAPAEIPSPKSRKSASNAGGEGLMKSASVAEKRLSENHRSDAMHVALNVLIDLEVQQVEIRKAGKLLWSASSAGGKNAFLQHMPVASFARTVVAICSTGDQIIGHGRVELLLKRTRSTRRQNGKEFASISGQEIADAVADVDKSTSRQLQSITSITSAVTLNSPNYEPTRKTLSCYVLNAIASFIQEEMQGENSFSIELETSSGWTRIPGLSGWRDVGSDEDIESLRNAGHEVRTNKKTGKSRVNDPDGPRYKSLGNSFTVEPVNWIMARAQASMRGLPMPSWRPMRLWSKKPDNPAQ